MNPNHLIARYDGRVPRYTSYPTAPHFHGGVGADTYAAWLAQLDPEAPISVYLHVPFCDRLCLYCGCTTTVARAEGPRRAYGELLVREIEMVAHAIGHRLKVGHIHWGGGTPTTLPPDTMVGVMEALAKHFDILPDAEIAAEIDPAFLRPDRLQALADIGLNRASLGVQDLDPKVQAAIGRPQSQAVTQAAAEALRGIGVGSLNIDLIYGLPHQTLEGAVQTARSVLELDPDRIAVFGYAHVPWMKAHQRLIQEQDLPDGLARFHQQAAIGEVFGDYRAVGLDHYAKSEDSMARAEACGGLKRNFQGYTTDGAETLIAFGASAIGALAQGYVQNAPKVPDYAAALRQGRLATHRGVTLSHDDKLRRHVIERLMCDMKVDLAHAAAKFGVPHDTLAEDAANLKSFEDDGLIERRGATIVVREAGRPFLRNAAAVFDAFLKTSQDAAPRHARAI